MHSPLFVQVLLNQEAAPVEALCEYIFDGRTSQLLGEWSTCTARGNVLTIQLAGMRGPFEYWINHFDVILIK
jgi:hypothetical protein